MKFNSDKSVERFHAWIATRNSQYRRIIVLGDPAREYRVSSDEPHVLIGMTVYEGRYTYELIGPDDLIGAVLVEIQESFPDVIRQIPA